jgi:hypothetical protein
LSMSPEQPSSAKRSVLPRRSDGDGPRERDGGSGDSRGWWAQLAETEAPTRPPARFVDASKSRRELYRDAQQAGIKGRSGMNKQQLVEALQRHHATGSPAAPATRRAPGPPRRAGAEPQPRVPAERAGGEVDRPRSPREQPEPERCVIEYRGSDRQGEFHVVIAEADGSRRTVARSPAFPAPGGEMRGSRAARAAHELLVQRLDVCGWWPAGSAEAWPELEFIRVRPGDSVDARSFVTVVREGGRARFVAEELDRYGNPTPLIASEPFSAPRLLPVRPSRRAKAALDELLLRMEAEGWTFAEATEGEWYAILLRRDP